MRSSLAAADERNLDRIDAIFSSSDLIPETINANAVVTTAITLIIRESDSDRKDRVNPVKDFSHRVGGAVPVPARSRM